MASASGDLRRALRELVDRRAPLRVPAGYAGLLELYGSNAAIADAAGFITAAEARRRHLARWPKARKTTLKKREDDARRRRQTFLRNLQRYSKGRRPDSRSPTGRQVERLRRQGIERNRLERGVVGVAQLIVDEGSVCQMSAEITVSSDTRFRELPPVNVVPDQRFVTAVQRGDWEQAALLYFDEWAAGYGIGRYVIVEEIEELTIALGLAPEELGYRRAVTRISN